ncbi:MAG: hypothetical protein OEN01_02575 [Candidatus Krumholzibacteria bacterium]|nr:hypothetical protein [Candidatus Krumholzibacteria bacterium]
MIRLVIFLLGLGMFLAGAASHFQHIRMPIDLRSITWSLGSVALTLDVVLMVAGVFFILVAWVFHRLNTLS